MEMVKNNVVLTDEAKMVDTMAKFIGLVGKQMPDDVVAALERLQAEERYRSYTIFRKSRNKVPINR